MTPIVANQLIFTNVEAEQSPRKQRGYQTLFYSHEGLSEAEVLEVETRLFYVPKGEKPKKHVFCQTSTGKTVIAQIVPLTGTDQFGRAGRYFAHALIFSSETFERIGNNPFAVFRNFPFWTRVEEAIAAGDFATGNVPPAQFSLLSGLTPSPTDIPSHPTSPVALNATQLCVLLLLAAQARRLVEERCAIGFFGATDAVFELLEVLFAFVPPPLRPFCSFDTLFSGGTLSRTPCWAVGLPSDEPRKPNLITFDLAQREFAGEVKCASTSAFERWLEHVLEREPLSHVARQSESAYWLGEWFDGRLQDTQALAQMDNALFQTFTELNRSALENRVRERLGQQVGAALGRRIFPEAFAWLELQGGAAVHHLEQGFEVAQLSEWLYRVYSDPTQRPSPQELQELRQFVSRHHQRRLELICARWAGEWERLTKTLQSSNEEEFRWFADWALSTLSLRITWGIYRSDQGTLFGPLVTCAEQKTEECHHLLLALLGVSEEQAAAPPAAAPSRGLNWVFPLGRRAELPASPVVRFPTGVNVERWLCLMEMLNKRR